MTNFGPQWIAGLMATESSAREKAASAIYRAGRELAESATAAWWQNQHITELCGQLRELTVGVAVGPDTFAGIRDANGQPPLAKVPPEQDAAEFELHFPKGVALDILTTRDPKGNGVIAKFLARQGDGIQQVEYRCRNVDRVSQILRQELGVASVYPEARPGADDTRVNFFLLVSGDGRKVLVELYEKKSELA